MHALIRFPLVCIGAAAGAYVVFCALLYLQQEQSIFFGVINDPVLVERWRAKRVEIRTAEIVIEGWWAQNSNANNNLTILYFGGNAEDVLYLAESAGRFNARRILVTNYRGYGATPGEPSETALFLDATAIYDYAVKQPGVSRDKIVVMGRSLGTGVATYLTSQRSVRTTILVTPFDSMTAVGQGHYPIFPVSWLLKHKFESDKLALGITTPVLVIAAERDDIVPPVRAQKLFDAWSGLKQLRILDGVGHNDIQLHSRYFESINSFLGDA